MHINKVTPHNPARQLLRLLVVEDSTEILDGLVHALGTRNFTVVATAASASSAIQWLRDQPQGCDAAVIDYFLHTGTGLDVLEFLESAGSPIGRAVLTNYATDAIRGKCMQAGAARVFDKSSEFEALMDWLTAFHSGSP